MVKVEEAVGTTGAETDKATFLGGVYGVGEESGRHIFEKNVGQSPLEVRGSARGGTMELHEIFQSIGQTLVGP